MVTCCRSTLCTCVLWEHACCARAQKSRRADGDMCMLCLHCATCGCRDHLHGLKQPASRHAQMHTKTLPTCPGAMLTNCSSTWPASRHAQCLRPASLLQTVAVRSLTSCQPCALLPSVQQAPGSAAARHCTGCQRRCNLCVGLPGRARLQPAVAPGAAGRHSAAPTAAWPSHSRLPAQGCDAGQRVAAQGACGCLLHCFGFVL